MTRTPSLPRGVKERHGPTGLTVWMDLPDSSPGFGIMWAGTGSRLLIGQPTTPGGAVTTIDHPTADVAYYSRAEARAAVIAFLRAWEKS